MEMTTIEKLPSTYPPATLPTVFAPRSTARQMIGPPPGKIPGLPLPNLCQATIRSAALLQTRRALSFEKETFPTCVRIWHTCHALQAPPGVDIDQCSSSEGTCRGELESSGVLKTKFFGDQFQQYRTRRGPATIVPFEAATSTLPSQDQSLQPR